VVFGSGPVNDAAPDDISHLVKNNCDFSTVRIRIISSNEVLLFPKSGQLLSEIMFSLPSEFIIRLSVGVWSFELAKEKSYIWR
jgi:hypothetical protein